MLSAVDEGIANVTAALKRRNMWDNTLLVFTADNGAPICRSKQNTHSLNQGVLLTGGPIAGSSRCHICGDHTGSENTPLRGGKHSLWQGGVRGTAFVHGVGIQRVRVCVKMQ